MAKYLLAYRGGDPGEGGAPDDDVMAEWMGWFATIGESLTDMGNPLVASTAIAPDGSSAEPGDLTGYSIIEADSLEAAARVASACPHLRAGGTVDVYEATPM